MTFELAEQAIWRHHSGGHSHQSLTIQTKWMINKTYRWSPQCVCTQGSITVHLVTLHWCRMLRWTPLCLRLLFPWIFVRLCENVSLFDKRNYALSVLAGWFGQHERLSTPALHNTEGTWSSSSIPFMSLTPLSVMDNSLCFSPPTNEHQYQSLGVRDWWHGLIVPSNWYPSMQRVHFPDWVTEWSPGYCTLAKQPNEHLTIEW